LHESRYLQSSSATTVASAAAAKPAKKILISSVRDMGKRCGDGNQIFGGGRSDTQFFPPHGNPDYNHAKKNDQPAVVMV
jgi:hypothetical protein